MAVLLGLGWGEEAHLIAVGLGWVGGRGQGAQLVASSGLEEGLTLALLLGLGWGEGAHLGVVATC